MKFAANVQAARIAVEAIQAPLLLYGSDADEVWNSGVMVPGIARDMKRADSAHVVTAATFRDAGHGICGDGTTPAAFFANGASPDARSTAAANSQTWRGTLAFLHAQLDAYRERYLR